MYGGSEGIAPCILNPGSRWGYVLLIHYLAALISRSLGGKRGWTPPACLYMEGKVGECEGGR